MAYLFYGLDRFSVDLDFDLLEPISFGELDGILLPILKNYGAVVGQKDKNYAYFYLLPYQKGARALKVEISKKVSVTDDYRAQNLYGISMPIQKEDVALASKMLACLERKWLASRDFFDVNYYLAKGVFPNKAYIKNRADITLKEAVTRLLARTAPEALNEKTLLWDLGSWWTRKRSHGLSLT